MLGVPSTFNVLTITNNQGVRTDRGTTVPVRKTKGFVRIPLTIKKKHFRNESCLAILSASPRLRLPSHYNRIPRVFQEKLEVAQSPSRYHVGVLL